MVTPLPPELELPLRSLRVVYRAEAEGNAITQRNVFFHHLSPLETQASSVLGAGGAASTVTRKSSLPPSLPIVPVV